MCDYFAIFFQHLDLVGNASRPESAAAIVAPRGLGYDLVDLDEWLIPHFQLTRADFEYPDDADWNGIGRGIAAEAVALSGAHRLQA